MAFIKPYLDPSGPQLLQSIGMCSVIRGIWCLRDPEKQYEEFGLPLERERDHEPQHEQHGSFSFSAAPTGAVETGTETDTSKTDANTAQRTTQISPLMYVKGIRDICYGILFWAFSIAASSHRSTPSGIDGAVTYLILVGAIMSAGDALVVWRFGGARKKTARRHAIIAAAWFAWVFWRWPARAAGGYGL
ncbi:hypothetical protein BJY04DRAFT_139215 [Aspergillus karnatakaensis]|uniref:DUF4267 domain-containing protein n=1 Tax=Aspergillus karnatakaensis TaxID=1810916 RepID=UPI003CCCEA72